jgi:hypothetical protein
MQLTFYMLTDKEKEKYVSLVNKIRNLRHKSDDERADEYNEKSEDIIRAILTAGTSIVFYKALSLFYASKSAGLIPGLYSENSPISELKSHLSYLKQKYDCDRIDVDSFPYGPHHIY